MPFLDEPHIFMTRFLDDGRQTLSVCNATGKDGKTFNFRMLELPNRGNQQNISCIPAGVYNVKKRYSPKFKLHFHIQNVPGREYILIHPANFYKDLRGCMAPGDGFIDINGDGHRDVVNSRATLDNLLSIMPDSFKIYISTL